MLLTFHPMLLIVSSSMIREAGCSRPLGVTAVVSNVNKKKVATHIMIWKDNPNSIDTKRPPALDKLV